MLQQTQSSPFRKALATNATDSSFASRVYTVTEPTGAGVLEMGTLMGGAAQNIAIVVPFGIGSDNDTFDIRLLGWRKIVSTSQTIIAWQPVPLVEATCTLCAQTGVAGSSISSSNRLADTVVLKTAYQSKNSIEVISPTGDVAGHIAVDFKGFQKLEVQFAIVSGTTSMNCLISEY